MKHVRRKRKFPPTFSTINRTCSSECAPLPRRSQQLEPKWRRGGTSVLSRSVRTSLETSSRSRIRSRSSRGHLDTLSCFNGGKVGRKQKELFCRRMHVASRAVNQLARSLVCSPETDVNRSLIDRCNYAALFGGRTRSHECKGGVFELLSLSSIYVCVSDQVLSICS